MNKDRLFIHMVINKKYHNEIYPNLPKQLIIYLLNNPNKIGFYINKHININKILKQLKISKINNDTVLNEIIKIIEVENDLSW